MKPESTSVTLRRDLSAVAQEYDESAAGRRFIGERACPLFRAAQAAADFPIFNRESLKKPAKTGRAPDGRYNRIGGLFSSGNYKCEDNGLEYPLDDFFVRKYAAFIDAEQAAARILRWQIRMARERRVAALYSGSGSTNHNATTIWSTSATAVPIKDLLTGLETLEDAAGVGREAMKLIIPRDAYRELLATTEVSNKVIYTYPGVQPALLSGAQVAAMLGIAEVLLAGGSYDAAEEGVTESNTQIWTAGICYLAILAEPDAPLEIPSAARLMLWTEDSPELPVVERYRDESARADIERMRDSTDEVLTADTDLMVYKLTV